jgi:hypothetical protein
MPEDLVLVAWKRGEQADHGGSPAPVVKFRHAFMMRLSVGGLTLKVANCYGISSRMLPISGKVHGRL